MVKLLQILYVVGSLLWMTVGSTGEEEIYKDIRTWYKKNKDQHITFYPSERIQTLHQKSVHQIILIRHGDPEINRNGWFSYKAARKYVVAYDTVGVKPIGYPPVTIGPHQDVLIYCSPLVRAYDTSQKIFGKDMEIKVDSSFIEFQREVIPLPLILPIKGWTSLSRFFWILGLHSSDVPSFKSEKSRAERDADYLDHVAQKEKRVILVAHGFFE